MVFGDDPARLGVTRYRLLICAEKPGLISTLSGFKIQVDHGFDALEQRRHHLLAVFGSPASFRQHFLNSFAVSPSAYRRQFGTPP